ncbi:3-methyladenine DNA glycosylase [Amnibacterium flavum]|uniref:3-methyladenine DNA glycosylase n=1 Tax=Amnibacterium flavum TaxID=2173173 RepID=A0A2V1HY28_9MICO|nr:3-methyladenine DNA glycosylase [Amnibacterium flavum]
MAPVVETPVRESVYRPREPVSLRLVLGSLGRGHGDPTFRWDLDGRHGAPGVWRTLLTPEGPATIHLAQRLDGDIVSRAWGAGAEWATDQLPRTLGSEDDWSGLDVSSVPLLADTLRRRPDLRISRVDLVLEMMIPAIIEQRITGLEARRAWRYLLSRYGTTPPGPAPQGMRVFPDATTWRRIPSWEWHKAGVDPARSRTCIRAATVADGLERTLAFDPGREVESRMRTIAGVGVWTAAETAQRSHGDPDSVSYGDYHVHDVVGYALSGEPADDDRMLELLEPWRGHRQRIVRLIYASGFRKPRFGPRMTVQDHRAH